MVSLNLEIPEPMKDEEDATYKQVQFIRSLMRDAGASGFPEDTLQELGKWQASSLIDQLQDFKKQLRGEMPIDEEMVTGLDDDSSTLDDESLSSDLGKIVLAGLAVIFILLIVFSS